MDGFGNERQGGSTPDRGERGGAPAPADPGPAAGRPESHLLVNLTIDRRFDYRFLYRLISLALRSGGRLDRCNGESARFAFPEGKVADFMGEVGSRAPVRRALVSPRDKGGSWVNVSFQA